MKYSDRRLRRLLAAVYSEHVSRLYIGRRLEGRGPEPTLDDTFCTHRESIRLIDGKLAHSNDRSTGSPMFGTAIGRDIWDRLRRGSE